MSGLHHVSEEDSVFWVTTNRLPSERREISFNRFKSTQIAASEHSNGVSSISAEKQNIYSSKSIKAGYRSTAEIACSLLFGEWRYSTTSFRRV